MGITHVLTPQGLMSPNHLRTTELLPRSVISAGSPYYYPSSPPHQTICRLGNVEARGGGPWGATR